MVEDRMHRRSTHKTREEGVEYQLRFNKVVRGNRHKVINQLESCYTVAWWVQLYYIKDPYKLNLNNTTYVSSLPCTYSFSFLSRWFLLHSSTITGQEGDCRQSPAASGWLPDSWLQLSQRVGPACPQPLGSPQGCAAPQGSECAACRQRWAAGHMDPGAPVGAPCLSSLEEKLEWNKNVRQFFTWEL